MKKNQVREEGGVEKGSYSKPNNVVRIGWETGATLVLLVSERFDDNGIIQRAYSTDFVSSCS